jgi:hypothetical protein
MQLFARVPEPNPSPPPVRRARVPPSSSPPPPKRWIWRAPYRPCANPLQRFSTTPSPPLATSPTPSPSAPSTSVTAAPHSRTLSLSVAWVLALLFYSLTDAPTTTFLRKLDLMTEGGGGGRRPAAPRVHDLRRRLLRGAPRSLRRGAQGVRAPRRRHPGPPRLLRLRGPW